MDRHKGALAAADPGAVLVECSTVSPAWIKELAARLARETWNLLDAPVTGSRVQAQHCSTFISGWRVGSGAINGNGPYYRQ